MLLGFAGEVIGRPVCRRLFGRPALATASTAVITVLVTIVSTRGSLVATGTALLVWSWGWGLGGLVSGRRRRTDASTSC